MSKNRKKRFKPYRGEDAAGTATTPSQPTVHRYVATPKNPAQEWWQGRKKIVMTSAKIAAVAIIAVWLVYEAVKLAF